MLGGLAGTQRTFRTFAADVDGGWREKMSILRGLIQGDVTDLELQEHFAEAMRLYGARERVAEDEIHAWFDYLRAHARYTPASLGYRIGDDGRPLPLTQVLIRPAVLFRRRLGDCTAFAAAASAGLGIAGYDSDLVLISTKPDGVPSHIYNRIWYPARTHQRAVAFDAAAPHPLGWEVPSNRVTWSAIIPAFAPWSGDTRTTGRTQLTGFGSHRR